MSELKKNELALNEGDLEQVSGGEVNFVADSDKSEDDLEVGNHVNSEGALAKNGLCYNGPLFDWRDH